MTKSLFLVGALLLLGAANLWAFTQAHLKKNTNLELLLDPRITTNERIDFLSQKNTGRVNTIIQENRNDCAKVKDSDGVSSRIGRDFQTFMANMFVKQLCEPTSDVVDEKVRGASDGLAKVDGGQHAPATPLVEAFSIMYSHSYLEAGTDPMTIPHLASARPTERERGLFHASPNSLVNHPELGRIMAEYINRLHDLGETLAKNPERKTEILSEYSHMCGTPYFMDDYKKEKSVSKSGFITGSWEKNKDGTWKVYSDLSSEEPYGMTTVFKPDPSRQPSSTPMTATDSEVLDTTFSAIQNVLNKPINKSCLETSGKLDAVYRDTFNAIKTKALGEDIADLSGLGIPDLVRLDFNSVVKAIEKTNEEIEKLTALSDELSKKHQAKVSRVDESEEELKRKEAILGREKRKLDEKEVELVGSFGSDDETAQSRLLSATQNFAQTTSKTTALLDLHKMISQLVKSTSQTSKEFGFDDNFTQNITQHIGGYRYSFINDNPVLFVEAPAGKVNELMVESLKKDYSQDPSATNNSQSTTPNLESLPYMKKHMDNYLGLHKVNQERAQLMIRQKQISSSMASLGKDLGAFQTQYDAEELKIREKLKTEANRLFRKGHISEKQFVLIYNSSFAKTLNATDYSSFPASIYKDLSVLFALRDSLGRRVKETQGNLEYQAKLLRENAERLEANKNLYDAQLKKSYDELLPEVAASVDQSAIDRQALLSSTKIFVDKSAEADELRKRVQWLETSTRLSSGLLSTNKKDLDSRASAENLRQLKVVQKHMQELVGHRLERLALLNFQLQKVRQDFRKEIFSWKMNHPKIKDVYWDINLMDGVTDHAPTNAAAACFATLQRFCPTFGVDYQATYLRFAGEHFGPINRGEVKPACVQMFNSLNAERSRLCSLR